MIGQRFDLIGLGHEQRFDLIGLGHEQRFDLLGLHFLEPPGVFVAGVYQHVTQCVSHLLF